MIGHSLHRARAGYDRTDNVQFRNAVGGPCGNHKGGGAMNKGKLLAGVDAGHIHTKAVIMRGGGNPWVLHGTHRIRCRRCGSNRTRGCFGAVAGIAVDELGGIVTTGIFRDVVKYRRIERHRRSVPEYVADARGALFLNRNSRTRDRHRREYPQGDQL